MSAFQSNSIVHVQNHSELDLSADADLVLRLGNVLALKHRAGWHLVRYEVQNGVVELAGTVPTSYDRQLIAALARHVAGVRRVHDALEIGEPSLRQQVTETTDTEKSTPAPAAEPPQNQFAHLPVLDVSLDDMLAALPVAAVA